MARIKPSLFMVTFPTISGMNARIEHTVMASPMDVQAFLPFLLRLFGG